MPPFCVYVESRLPLVSSSHWYSVCLLTKRILWWSSSLSWLLRCLSNLNPWVRAVASEVTCIDYTVVMIRLAFIESIPTQNHLDFSSKFLVFSWALTRWTRFTRELLLRFLSRPGSPMSIFDEFEGTTPCGPHPIHNNSSFLGSSSFHIPWMSFAALLQFELVMLYQTSILHLIGRRLLSQP